MAQAEMEHCYGPIVYTEIAQTITTVVAEAVLIRPAKREGLTVIKLTIPKNMWPTLRFVGLNSTSLGGWLSIYRHLPDFWISINIRKCLGQVFG